MGGRRGGGENQRKYIQNRTQSGTGDKIMQKT